MVVPDTTPVVLFEIECEALPYVATDLGTLGFVGSEAYKINNQGLVIGGLATAAVMHTEVWDYFLYSNGIMDQLPVGWTADLNDAGQIAACNPYYYDSQGHVIEGLCARTVIWDAGVVINAGSLGNWSAPYDISESGAVVGASTVDSLRHAYHWDGTFMLDLGVPPGCDESEAVAVNESGQVLVNCWDLPDRDRGSFVWQSGSLTDLGPLFGSALNNAGVVVGFTLDGKVQAAMWSEGVVTELEVPGASTESRANLVNEDGQVAGYWEDSQDEEHAMLWNGRHAIDLGTGWTPRAINNNGSVVGNGFYGDAYYWAEGLLRELPGLEEGCSQNAHDINNLEQIVGDSCERAVLWEKQKPDPD